MIPFQRPSVSVSFISSFVRSFVRSVVHFSFLALLEKKTQQNSPQGSRARLSFNHEFPWFLSIS
jgi:hypothetical protein